MGALIILLSLLLLAPIVLVLVGLIMRFNAKETLKEKGKKLMLWGAIVLAAEILIGYALCSNMRFNVH